MKVGCCIRYAYIIPSHTCFLYWRVFLETTLHLRQRGDGYHNGCKRGGCSNGLGGTRCISGTWTLLRGQQMAITKINSEDFFGLGTF